MTLSGMFSGTAEGNALIKGAVIADDGGLSYNHSASVVNEHALAYFCAGMYFDSGKESGGLADGSCGKPVSAAVKHVCQTVGKNCVKSGIESKDFKRIGSRRVTVANHLNVGLDLVVTSQGGVSYFCRAQSFGRVIQCFFVAHIRASL